MNLVSKWNDFWFRPGRAFDLAFVRIVLVGLQLFVLLSYSFPNLVYSLGLPEYMYEPRIVLRLLMPWGMPPLPSEGVVMTAFWITFAAGLLSLVGLFTNLSLLVFTVLNVMLQGFIYSFRDIHHPEAVMLLALIALTLGPSGRVLSVDAWLASRRQGQGGTTARLLELEIPYARWPIVFLQWFFPLMYLSAVVSKLTRGGIEWANGISLQYFMILEFYKNDSALALYLSEFHWPLRLAEYVVLVFQATFWVIVFYPRLRWIYLPLGIIFHTVIYVTLRAPFPQWIAMYMVYIPWALLFLRLAEQRVSGPLQPTMR